MSSSGRSSAAAVQTELDQLADPARAEVLRGYFKTGPGQYGEGDVFIGVTVPLVRSVARKHRVLSPNDVIDLLHSEVHEHRLAACLILSMQARSASGRRVGEILDLFLSNTARVNNWDLVDSSAPDVVGHAILQGAAEESVLDGLARSESLWERRIAIVATYTLIRAGRFQTTLEIAKTLLDDPHDLIHKATGWMLREVGKRSRATLESFLDEYAARMPRTALRYAIERFDPDARARYLAIKRVR